MSRKNKTIATRAVHSARNPSKQSGMVNTPVYHGSTIIYDSLDAMEYAKNHFGEKDELIYGRFGTPTTFAFENAVADLESGYAGLAVSSGLAAITTAILAFIKHGDHVLMVDSAYFPSRQFCDKALNRYGVEVTYYDPMIGADIEALIQANTRVIFMESPGSQTFEVQDVPAIVDKARKHNIVTIIDNSWASPVYYRPIEHGVNVSVIAATKYLVGHSDAMLGVIVTDEAHYQVVRDCRDVHGQCAGPDDIYLGLRGLRTLDTRMRHHHREGLKVAKWLDQHPKVERVLHPALPNCPGHEIWVRDFDGASGLFSFELEDRPQKNMADMLDNMTYFSMGASWGGFESLLIPAFGTASRTAAKWLSKHQLFRIHIGLEDTDELIADIEAGIERYFD